MRPRSPSTAARRWHLPWVFHSSDGVVLPIKTSRRRATFGPSGAAASDATNTPDVYGSDYEALLADIATPQELLESKRRQFGSLAQLKEHCCRKFASHVPGVRIELCSFEEAGGGCQKWNRWQVFERRYREGDELWYFDTPVTDRNDSSGCCGYLIIRDQRLHALFLVAIR